MKSRELCVCFIIDELINKFKYTIKKYEVEGNILRVYFSNELIKEFIL